MDFKKVMDSMSDNITHESKYKNIDYYHVKDKESLWEYFIFDGEINVQKNEIIKDILTKHLESENISEVNKKIKKIIKYENSIDEMNKQISECLSNYRKFYDILVIIVDKLLDEKSKFIFKFFQDISTQKNKQPFILFLTKKEEPKVDVLYQFITNVFYDKRNLEAFKFPSNDIEKDKILNFFLK